MNFNSIESDICAQEDRVREEIKKLNELHQKRTPEEVKNYTFKTSTGEIALSALFKDKDELIVIHNMGSGCSYCTLWADGFNGYYHQMGTRAEFVVINNDKPEIQQAFAASRNWKFPMVSGYETNFAKDMGFYSEEDGEGMVWPGVTIFKKESNGKIYRTTKAGFGPGDLYSSIWHLFELLPRGLNGWQPTMKI